MGVLKDCLKVKIDANFILFYFAVLGLELRVYTLTHSTIFVKGFFEIASPKLFAWAGFKP
jgi:hypothetical protein